MASTARAMAGILPLHGLGDLAVFAVDDAQHLAPSTACRCAPEAGLGCSVSRFPISACYQARPSAFRHHAIPAFGTPSRIRYPSFAPSSGGISFKSAAKYLR